jgi:hypothetical protein
MGLKLTGALRCGACGKPRGIGVHLCQPGRRRRQRTTLRNPVTWECGSCHQPRGLRHSCGNRGDFRKRKRQAATAERRHKRKAAAVRRAARRKEAAVARRARERARKEAAKTRPRASRLRGESHEPGTCGNRDCPKYGCRAYWQGMDNCPGPHEGE